MSALVATLERIGRASWRNLDFGFELGWLSEEDLIRVAERRLAAELDSAPRELVLLAGGELLEHGELPQLLEELAGADPHEDPLDPWRLAWLEWALEEPCDDEVAASLIDDVGDELSWPVDGIRLTEHWGAIVTAHVENEAFYEPDDPRPRILDRFRALRDDLRARLG